MRKKNQVLELRIFETIMEVLCLGQCGGYGSEIKPLFGPSDPGSGLRFVQCCGAGAGAARSRLFWSEPEP
jgi:hypothetical protein